MTHLPANHRLENERRLQTAFLLYGVAKVTVEFEGSGDSGQIESIAFEASQPGFDETLVTVEVWAQRASEFNPKTQKWEQPPAKLKRCTLDQAVRNLVNDALDEAGVDWYNNDGGFGSWVWSGAAGVEFEISVRVTDSEVAHAEQRQLGQVVEDENEEDEAASP